jgi:hypothetical protein
VAGLSPCRAQAQFTPPILTLLPGLRPGARIPSGHVAFNVRSRKGARHILSGNRTSYSVPHGLRCRSGHQLCRGHWSTKLAHITTKPLCRSVSSSRAERKARRGIARRKRDIHKSDCESEGFRESRTPRKKAKLIMEKRALERYAMVGRRWELYARGRRGERSLRVGHESVAFF